MVLASRKERRGAHIFMLSSYIEPQNIEQGIANFKVGSRRADTSTFCGSEFDILRFKPPCHYSVMSYAVDRYPYWVAAKGCAKLHCVLFVRQKHHE